jgi:hypothetical protein
MPTKIIDLDELASEPKRVRLAGRVYTLPGDLPVELWLRLQRQAQEEGQSDGEALRFLYEQILELFRFGDPKIKELPLGMAQLITLIAKVYGDDEAEPARPTRRTGSRAGTSNTTSKRRPKSQRS